MDNYQKIKHGIFIKGLIKKPALVISHVLIGKYFQYLPAKVGFVILREEVNE